MLYKLHDLNTYWTRSLNLYAGINATMAKDIPWLKQWYAGNRLLERFTRAYPRPKFNLGVTETRVIKQPFGDLLLFGEHHQNRPNLLIVAPMSGHYATLLRGIVKEFITDHNVYITDWHDAGEVPLDEGTFSLDSYIDYIRAYIRFFKGDVHILAVCQPSVPVLAAVALLSENQDAVPHSMTLMGGPVDTRCSPTEINKFALRHSYKWFSNHAVQSVPATRKGAGRSVYPGFLQLAGFLSMNLSRHLNAHRDYFDQLIEGDGDNARQHEAFYDEYLAVMDLDAPFYLDTIRKIFLEHQLPTGNFSCNGQRVRPELITRTALMTIEGERDDITGRGQTEAAHQLCPNVPLHAHYTQDGVGHYGLFNGRRFREHIAPRIRKFIAESIVDRTTL